MKFVWIILLVLGYAAPAFAQISSQEIKNREVRTVLACDTTANKIFGGPDTTIQATCPSGCRQTNEQAEMGMSAFPIIWGTGTYTDDSAICIAAIHAGVLTESGGDIFIIITPGQSTYLGSVENDIQSDSWEAWERSFVVEKVSD